MSKTGDVARRFQEWMERYDHRDETPSESFKTFIVADRCIAEYGVSYDEYTEVADKVKSLGHAVEWLVPKDTFDFLVKVSRRHILER
jgi:hypothetical protein